MTAVLVTGASGFLGRFLVDDLLAAGYRVRALARSSADLSFPPSVEVMTGDLLDPLCTSRAAAGCDTIVHLAGKAHAIDDSGESDEEYRSVNVDGTRHLLERAAGVGVKRFIFASSVKVFGETTSGSVDETVPAAPQSSYARSKWMAEQLVASYNGRGLAAVSLRLPLVYGPTKKGNLYRMIEAIDKGRFPALPRVRTVRSMLHVGNFSLAVRAVLQSSDLLKPMYVVTDAEPYSITDVYDLLRRQLGQPPPRWRVPLAAWSWGGRCGDLLQALLKKPVPFSSSTFEKLFGEGWYSPRALIRDLGYQPRVTFETAVPELVEYYRRARS